MADRITYKVHDIVIPQANDPTKTISKTVYEAENHHAESGMIGFSAPDATLVSNVLTPVDSLTVVRGEGASADTIDHISFTADPQINDKDLVWLQQGAEAITINHNTSSPPANAGPVLLLSQVPKKMIGSRMVLLQRQGSNFQEIAYDGIVGNGGILAEDDEGNAVIVCGSVPSAVNHLKATNAATGNDVVIEAIGTDPNIDITITPKGTGLITLLNTKITNIRESTGDALAIIITGAASIVNHFEIKPSITTADLEINALGTDTNIGIKITPKGTGRVTILEQIVTNIREATGGAIAIAITAIASAVNFIEVKANITANDPEIEAKGSDTNVGIKLIPKGTGLISADNFEGTGTKRIEREITTTTVALDLTDNDFQTISISANTTFTTSNRASGRSKTIRIITDATLRTLTFPAWIFVGTAPTDQAASKTGILTITAFGTADTDIVAAYAVEA